MKSKTRGSIFRMLVSSYILFALMIVVSLLIALFIAIAVMTGSVAPRVEPFALVDAPDSSTAATMTSLGAWAEGLNGSYAVVKVLGNKSDEIMQYTQSEIFALLDTTNESFDTYTSEYRAFLREEPMEGGIQYWMVVMPRDALMVQNSISLTNTGSNSTYYYVFSITLLVLFIMNCIWLSLFLSKRIRKPLAEISDGMRRIESGETDVRLDFKAQMEFGKIKDTFNIMSERIQTEKQAREDSERRKNQLLLDLSHDIKTPISTIKAYAHALDEGMVKPAEISRYLNTIDEKANRVGELSSDLFSILSMDNPDYHLDICPVDAAEVIREICASHYDESQTNGLEMCVDIPDSVLMVDADAKMLRRVLENLLGNAIKYNKTGRYIRVSIKREKGVTCFEIGDDGEAIPESQRNSMFNAFARGDVARTSTEGSGLGLAIAKAIMEKHGGTISYTRENNENVFSCRIFS